MSKVALVGRVNVGKSTLFNRLTETSKALVSPVAGTTRDRNYAPCLWRGLEFSLIDTGGIVGENFTSPIQKQVQKQVAVAMQEADLIIFIVDGQDGIMQGDQQVAHLLRQTKKQVLLTVNKVDGQKIRTNAQAVPWEKLGWGAPWLVSATTGVGTGDLLDMIVSRLKIGPVPTPEKNPITKIAIIGKPNVGKSSLLNVMVGQERMIVSEIPFTTREPQDTLIAYKNTPLILIDTAGIRKKSHVAPGLERIGVAKTIHALDQADIAILMLDPFQEGLGSQDMALGQLIKGCKKSVITVVNKCDLANKKQMASGQLKITKLLPHLTFAPTLFISAKAGKNVELIFTTILKVAKERKKTIPQEDLDAFLVKAIAAHEATIYTKRRQKDKKTILITAISQLRYDPPVFLIEKNTKEPLPQGYQGFVENKFREKFGFIGTPLEFRIKAREKETTI